MIVTCSKCAARYMVDPAQVGTTGRMVRCARCSHTWFQRPPDDMPRRIETMSLPEILRPIPPGSNLPALRGPRRSVSNLGWIALALVVAALLGGGLGLRQDIVAAWPPSARLYEAIGLAPPAEELGLDLLNVRSNSVEEGGVTVLLVEGEVYNSSARIQIVPPIRVALMDKQRQEITSWTVEADKSELKPEERATFSARISSPPAGASSVSVSLDVAPNG
jgi:predicted Zn finger-like uncharacterized protein